MDERERAPDRRDEADDERRDGEPPPRPLTEWTRERKERDEGEETPGLDVPPG